MSFINQNTMCRFSVRRWRSGIVYRVSVMAFVPAAGKKAAHHAADRRAM
jgi:hypothetical protein